MSENCWKCFRYVVISLVIRIVLSSFCLFKWINAKVKKNYVKKKLKTTQLQIGRCHFYIHFKATNREICSVWSNIILNQLNERLPFRMNFPNTTNVNVTIFIGPYGYAMMLICDQRNAKPMTVTSIYGIVASISNLSSQNAAAKPIC